jgi:HSF-type DNA-binding
LFLQQSSGQSVGIHSSLLQQLQGQPSQTLQLQGLLQGMAAPPSNQHQTEALASLLLSQLLRQAQQQPKRSGLQPTVSQHGTTGIAASSLPSAAASLPRAAQTSSVLHSTFAPPAECFPSTNLKTRDVSHAGKVKSVKNPDHDEKPSAAAKRKAFLNKRSHASGTMYRPSEKKRKISAASSSATIFSSTEKTNAPRGKNVFVLNEDFHPGDIPDLLFPWKLHDMLDDAEKNANLKRIISWNDDGVSFSIKDESEFTNGVMTKYFEEKEWDSFTQSLSSWGFVRFTSGAQKGSFIHRLLAKEKRSLCKQMRIRGKAVSQF